ncbi:hypothetical protein O181_022149 [Austropuccinia psidii MF-1]|uniref:Uncharacterized protein n=1 Tax=Austropuccinia psidii MF-1 TaxID=1389203 RepID=A0A9Q3CE85_9BASI|nr:hypothetical protein [Austropuccinia psidii MF-1]
MLFKEGGLNRNLEIPVSTNKRKCQVNQGNHPLQIKKAQKLTETEIQRNNCHIFFQGPNKEQMGIHEGFTYPLHTKDFMENKPQLNAMGSSNPIRFTTNSKEEDLPTPFHHSHK